MEKKRRNEQRKAELGEERQGKGRREEREKREAQKKNGTKGDRTRMGKGESHYVRP